MAESDDMDDPVLVELESNLSKKIEANSKQLRSIDERLESMEALLHAIAAGQNAGTGLGGRIRVGSENEPED